MQTYTVRIEVEVDYDPECVVRGLQADLSHKFDVDPSKIRIATKEVQEMNYAEAFDFLKDAWNERFKR